jgi:transposase
MTKQLGTIRRIPDDMWLEMAPILGEEKRQGTRGRPPVPFRKVMDGVLYVLRTGCQWKALPKEYGSGSTAHRRFQQWVSEGVFQKAWGRLLGKYEERRRIKWKWQSLDSSTVKAPLGGKDRPKSDRQGEAREQEAHPYGPEGNPALCRCDRSKHPRYEGGI